MVACVVMLPPSHLFAYRDGWTVVLPPLPPSAFSPFTIPLSPRRQLPLHKGAFFSCSAPFHRLIPFQPGGGRVVFIVIQKSFPHRYIGGGSLRQTLCRERAHKVRSPRRSSANKKGEYPLKNRIKNETQVIALPDLQGCSSSPRAISIAQLNTLLCLHLRPINLVVYKCPYSLEGMGYLILRCASRLDAFSVYHIRTRLFCYALGRTTDAPEVRPTRSSRTKVSSSQISNAHDR